MTTAENYIQMLDDTAKTRVNGELLTDVALVVFQKTSLMEISRANFHRVRADEHYRLDEMRFLLREGAYPIGIIAKLRGRYVSCLLDSYRNIEAMQGLLTVAAAAIMEAEPKPVLIPAKLPARRKRTPEGATIN